MTYIYLIQNCYGNANKVYIGKTITKVRKTAHKKKFGESIEYTVIDKINSLDRKDWEPLETYWIEQFRQWGFKIQNIRKKGGSGPEYQTLETRSRISNSLLGREYKIEWKQSASKPKPSGFGDKISSNLERSTKIFNSNRTHYSKNSERNKKISLNLTGKKHSKNTTRPKPLGFGDKISSNLERSTKIKKSNSKSVIQIHPDNSITIYPSCTEASKLTGISLHSISACALGKQNKAGGYIWKFTKNLLF
jgi:hypothetical protein